MNKKNLAASLILVFLIVFLSTLIYFINLSNTKTIKPSDRTVKERKEGISVIKEEDRTLKNNLFTEDKWGQIERQTGSPSLPEIFRKRYFITGELASINYDTRELEIRTKNRKDGEYILFQGKLIDNAGLTIINETGYEREVVNLSYFEPGDNVAIFFNNKAEIELVLADPETIKANIFGLDGVL
jgi:hypothetical protein